MSNKTPTSDKYTENRAAKSRKKKRKAAKKARAEGENADPADVQTDVEAEVETEVEVVDDGFVFGTMERFHFTNVYPPFTT